MTKECKHCSRQATFRARNEAWEQAKLDVSIREGRPKERAEWLLEHKHDKYLYYCEKHKDMGAHPPSPIPEAEC